MAKTENVLATPTICAKGDCYKRASVAIRCEGELSGYCQSHFINLLNNMAATNVSLRGLDFRVIR